MLEAYFDESGTHKGSPVMCVSGFLFNPRNCRAFCRDWRSVLNELGVGYLHMKEFAPGGGIYRDISSERRNYALRKFIRIIGQRKTFGITVACKEDEFRRLAAPRWFNLYGQPYTVCANLCLRAIGEWADDHSYYGKIAYFFEAGAKHQRELADLLEKCSKDAKAAKVIRYGSHTFADKKLVQPLQAADLLAWEFCKLEVDSHIHRVRPVRKSMAALGVGRGVDSAQKLYYMTGNHLKKFLADNPVLRT